jgi:benzoyl-CoA reductase/2-hydroxyglutaryl-CoA dehydratase subunit BcrC/BadD/HgdB
VEILIAMGFSVYFPENCGALIGAKKLSPKFITAANTLGYSPEICSYLTSDIGSYLLKESPLEKAYGIPGPPQPAVLVYNTNQCREIQDWFSFYSEEYQVPSLGIHSPWRLKEITREDIAYTQAQLKNLVADLEGITQQKFDLDGFKEVIKLSAEGSRQWSEFLGSAKNQPSPITFFDACIHMAPIVLMRGQKESVEYYQMLNEEVSKRVTHGTGAVENELCRFYWEGMPIWGRLRFLSELFAQESSAVVASTYCNSWNFCELNPAQPFESMARSYLEIFINRDERIKEKMLVAAAREYSVDAVIFHDAKTCPHNTNSRFGMPERIKEKYGIPTVVIFGDLNDTRCFSDEQTITLVQAFMENFKKGNRA